MIVDVTACKRERIKVDVTLAKRGARRAVPAVVTLPVKVAAKPILCEAEEEPVPQVAETVEEQIEIEESVQSEEISEEEISAEDFSEEECERITEEALSVIEEMLAEAEEDAITDEIEEKVSEALDELDVMNRRAEDMKERLDDELEQALDEINESADEDAEILSSTIGSELEALDSVLSKREKNDARTEASTVMRYFERDSDGEMVEVKSNEAKGQEVVCYDEKSGKLSRICGIIKKGGDDY